MLSIVIPVFNEVDSLRALYGELSEVAAEHGYELDVVFVDDGSKGLEERIHTLIHYHTCRLTLPFR